MTNAATNLSSAFLQYVKLSHVTITDNEGLIEQSLYMYGDLDMLHVSTKKANRATAFTALVSIPNILNIFIQPYGMLTCLTCLAFKADASQNLKKLFQKQFFLPR